ncbi:MAG: BamA/TamA family outer membrane protein [Deferrisomatales bacterium]|nr:BamA/TamA family outer membrane protein [Deferrisomatales bacterium]
MLLWAALWVPLCPSLSQAQDPDPAPQDDPRGELSAEAGPARPLTLRFEGNVALGEGKLRAAAVDDLADFRRKGHPRAGADDAAFQMEVAYRKEGFAFAAVDYRYQPGALTFVVVEGPRVTLGEIRITGNAAYPTANLLTFFGSRDQRFVRSDIEAGASGLRDYYYGNGYISVTVEKPQYAFSDDRSTVVVSVHIREGTRYFITGVSFGGDLHDEVGDALTAFSPSLEGKPYYPRRKLQLRSAVLEVYGNFGYPDARVQIHDRPGAVAGAVELEVVVESGPRVRIADVVVTRHGKTQAQFIRNRLQLAPGDLYDQQKERASFRQLYRTGLFTEVSLELEETADPGSRNLNVSVVEGPSRELFFEPGWGSYELLRARTGFREKNLFGKGRIARTEVGASVKSTDALVGLTDPWFLQTRVTADFPLAYRRRIEPSFTREESSASALFSRKLGGSFTATAGYVYSATRLLDVQVAPDENDAANSYGLGSLKGQLTFDNRDDLFFPSRGQRHFLSVEFVSPVLGGDIGFTRYTGGARWFLPLTGTTTVGVRYATGFILPSPQEVGVPLGERFFNGGQSTVRSFRESELGPQDASGEPLGGLAHNTVNLELRQRVFGRFGASLFLDYGNVSPNRGRSERNLPPYTSRDQVVSDTFAQYFQDFQPGVGFGLQYLLPVGPARADFAFNPAARVDEGQRRFVWHFSLGMAF